jgi:putative SOS response-associated peptidase YedK
MCGRVSLTAAVVDLEALFGLAGIQGWSGPRYNLAPSQDLLCIRAADGVREGVALRWGLLPFWARDAKLGYRLINARAETAASKNSFRAAFKRRRCLVAIDGFFEWEREGKTKKPWRIVREDGAPYALAGLWESWTDQEGALGEAGATVETATILTTEANALLARIHHRMPVILPPEAWEAWLDPAEDDRERLQGLLGPAPSSGLEMVRVSTWMNDARHEGPEAVRPLDGEEARRIAGAEVEATGD